MNTYKYLLYNSGKLYLWSLAKLVESVRWQGLKHGLGHYQTLCSKQNKALFVVGQDIQFCEEFHEKTFCYERNFGVQEPLRFFTYVSEAGKTSYTNVTDWVDFLSGKLLVRFSVKLVYVDKSTRKPIDLPEVFFRGLSEHLPLVKARPLTKVPPLLVPQETFSRRVHVLHSDCDMNKHANQATYIKWCADAGTHAAFSGHLNGFHGNIDSYKVKQTKIQYLGESNVNDKIDVYVWTDERSCVFFAVKNKNKIVYQMEMDFYHDDPKGKAKL